MNHARPVRSESHEIAVLEELFTATRESFEAFSASADKATRHTLKAQLGDRALERARVIALFEGQLRLLGMQTGATHAPLASDSAYAGLKTVVARGDEEEVLDTIGRAETALLDRFDAALSDPSLSPDTGEVIAEGRGRIAAGYRALLAQVAHRP